MKSYLYRLSLLCILFGAFTLNTALADDAVTNDVVTGNVTVSFADLNLTHPDGVASLYMRVKFAANKVCGVENMRVSLDITRNNRECVSSAINKAIGTIDDARLTALHQSVLEETKHS